MLRNVQHETPSRTRPLTRILFRLICLIKTDLFSMLVSFLVLACVELVMSVAINFNFAQMEEVPGIHGEFNKTSSYFL